jgi:membrane protease YdiL (CAAX protease family)
LRQIVFFFILFELALGVLGWCLYLGFPPEQRLVSHLSLKSFMDGLMFFLPLTGFIWIFVSGLDSKIKSLFKMRKVIQKSLGSFLKNATLVEIGLISLAAGIGEELLFRGFLQNKFGIFVASVLFGLAHSVTFLYTAVATAMGYYIGLVYEWSEYDLTTVIVLHAVYDFFALYFLKITDPMFNQTPSDD